MFKRLIATILASTMTLTSVPVDTVLGGLQDVSVEAEETVGSTEAVDQDSSEESGTEEGVIETNEENSEKEVDEVSDADEQSSEKMEGIDETADEDDFEPYYQDKLRLVYGDDFAERLHLLMQEQLGEE